MRRKRRSASWAIRHNLVSFVYQALVRNGLDCPPYRFDIVVVVGDIRVVHIHPITYSVRHLFPFAFVFPNALFAFLDKRLDTVFLYLRLAVNAKKFFHFEFDGQTVSIPACFSRNVISFHCLVSWDNIFHYSSQDMTYMRFAVCRRRTVVKRE